MSHFVWFPSIFVWREPRTKSQLLWQKACFEAQEAWLLGWPGQSVSETRETSETRELVGSVEGWEGWYIIPREFTTNIVYEQGPNRWARYMPLITSLDVFPVWFPVGVGMFRCNGRMGRCLYLLYSPSQPHEKLKNWPRHLASPTWPHTASGLMPNAIKFGHKSFTWN